MSDLTLDDLQAYQQKTFRSTSALHISTRSEAIDFVNQRGFVFFWPIKDICLPSLWVAVAGDRPVADEHDDPGHITWEWKDSLLGKRQWFYAKVLRRRATLIALPVLPYFYALSENYGDPEEDYLLLYKRGLMTQEAKAIYEALLEQGPLDTIALRRAARLTSRENEARFNRALIDLQVDLKILPVAVTQAGGWRYAFAFDLVIRHFPELMEQTRFIKEAQARVRLLEFYVRSVGATQTNLVIKLFGWTATQVRGALDELQQAGIICVNKHVVDQPGEYAVLAELY